MKDYETERIRVAAAAMAGGEEAWNRMSDTLKGQHLELATRVVEALWPRRSAKRPVSWADLEKTICFVIGQNVKLIRQKRSHTDDPGVQSLASAVVQALQQRRIAVFGLEGDEQATTADQGPPGFQG